MKLNVRQLLRDNLHPDTIGKNKAGNLVLRWGYYYRNGRTPEHYVARVRDFLTNQGIAHVIGASGDHFAAFSGGAPTAKQSHFYVEVQLLDETSELKENGVKVYDLWQAFLPVKNTEDWKGPIYASVVADSLNLVGAAVIYFLGTVMMPVGALDPQTNTIAVRADGYRGR